MAAVNDSPMAAITRRKRRWLWPRFQNHQDVDLHLKAIRKVVLGAVLFGLAGFGGLWLAPDRFQTRFPEGPALALLDVGSTTFLFALAAWFLPTRRSRVLAVVIVVLAASAAVNILAQGHLPWGTRAFGAAVWGLVGWMGLGAVRGTLRWHADRGSRIRWGNTAIAVAVPSLASTTIALLLMIMFLLLEEVRLSPFAAEDETLSVVLAGVWLVTWTGLAAVLTWHLPTMDVGGGASG